MSMKEHSLANEVPCVSMSRIGCGLDQLEWSKVEYIITGVFLETDIKIQYI